MLPESHEVVLLVNLDTHSALGHCYLDNLRYHALRFTGPIALELFSRVTLRLSLPETMSVTIFAQAVRLYEGPHYALRLLPGPGTETLLGAGREAAWELTESDEMEATSDFFERRVDLPDPETEITFLDCDLSNPDLTPIDEVLREGSGRFIEWLEREDQRHGNSPGPSLGPNADLTETTMIVPGKPTAADPTEVDRVARLRQMPLRKKMQLAVGGDATLRAALMRDPDPTLQSWVLRNPDLTEEEVAEFALSAELTPQALAFIYASPKWSLSAAIIKNLVLSPTVPQCDLAKLMVVLPRTELDALAQRPDVPPQVRKAARKALAEQSA